MAGVTVAVKVTDWPKVDGFGEESSDTWVAGAVTKFTVSIAKSVVVQVPAHVVRLKTTEVMLAPDWSRTPIYVASPFALLVTVRGKPRDVAPLKT